MANKSLPRDTEESRQGSCRKCQGRGYLDPVEKSLFGGDLSRELCGCWREVVSETQQSIDARQRSVDKLYMLYADRILASYNLKRASYRVPSRINPNREYTVVLTSQLATCTCPDRQINKNVCAHMDVIRRIKRESAVCIGCRGRFFYGALSQAIETEPGKNIDYGDWLCSSCQRVCEVDVA